MRVQTMPVVHAGFKCEYTTMRRHGRVHSQINMRDIQAGLKRSHGHTALDSKKAPTNFTSTNDNWILMNIIKCMM